MRQIVLWTQNESQPVHVRRFRWELIVVLKMENLFSTSPHPISISMRVYYQLSPFLTFLPLWPFIGSSSFLAFDRLLFSGEGTLVSLKNRKANAKYYPLTTSLFIHFYFNLKIISTQNTCFVKYPIAHRAFDAINIKSIQMTYPEWMEKIWFKSSFHFPLFFRNKSSSRTTSKKYMNDFFLSTLTL